MEARHAHLNLLSRAWQLREHVTTCDAMYVVLAEALDATMITCDVPLARAASITERCVFVARVNAFMATPPRAPLQMLYTEPDGSV